MTETSCEFLDDFLDDDLPSDQKSLFLAHLDDCEECRSAIQDWKSLRRALKQAAVEGASPSDALLQRIRPPVKGARIVNRRARSKQFASFVAIVVLLVIGRWFALNEPRQEAVQQTNDAITTVGEVPPAIAVQPVVTVTSPDDVIGVPIDVGDPNVIVVWVYPAIPISRSDSTISKMLPFMPPVAGSNP